MDVTVMVTGFIPGSEKAKQTACIFSGSVALIVAIPTGGVAEYVAEKLRSVDTENYIEIQQ